MIKLPVKQSRMDKILPYRQQITLWNNFFTEETAELLLRGEATGKTFARKVKENIIGTYYEECELKHCYSCKERLRIIAEKQAKALKAQAEQREKELAKQRKSDEETYWYIIEDQKKKQAEQDKLTSGHE